MQTNLTTLAPLDPERVLEQYGGRIYRLALRTSRDEADAEDVLQNTLLKIMRNAHTFRGDCDPMGWIYRIALNEARDIHRRRKNRPTVSLPDAPLEGVTRFSSRRDPAQPVEIASARELDRVVRDALAELPHGAREAIVLRDIEGLSYAECALLLSLTLAAFKTRLHRARLQLCARLALQLPSLSREARVAS